jgi:hypothetical protein
MPLFDERDDRPSRGDDRPTRTSERQAQQRDDASFKEYVKRQSWKRAKDWYTKDDVETTDMGFYNSGKPAEPWDEEQQQWETKGLSPRDARDKIERQQRPWYIYQTFLKAKENFGAQRDTEVYDDIGDEAAKRAFYDRKRAELLEARKKMSYFDAGLSYLDNSWRGPNFHQNPDTGGSY